MRKKIIAVFVSAIFLGACSSTGQLAEQEAATPKTETEQPVSSTEGENEMTYPQLSKEVAANEALVTMNTTKGPIKIKLFPEYAPKTVENFLTHAENGYYDGLIFHRVISDFMIQGGDPTGTGMGGESIYGETFEDEFSTQLFNLRGALSMANAGPNTNGSQFFIVQNSELGAGLDKEMEKAGFPAEVIEAYRENGGTPHLDHRHTVFGQVIEGMDVVDQIAAVETGSQDKPVEDVKIESIEILQK